MIKEKKVFKNKIDVYIAIHSLSEGCRHFFWSLPNRNFFIFELNTHFYGEIYVRRGYIKKLLESCLIIRVDNNDGDSRLCEEKDDYKVYKVPYRSTISKNEYDKLQHFFDNKTELNQYFDENDEDYKYMNTEFGVQNYFIESRNEKAQKFKEAKEKWTIGKKVQVDCRFVKNIEKIFIGILLLALYLTKN